MKPELETPSTGVLSSEREIASSDIPRAWTETRTPYPREKTVARIFEEIAAASPENIALEFEDQQITYGELNASANRLAHALKRSGIGMNVAQHKKSHQ